MIATPIGNMDDLTVRAKDLLHKLQFIVCEDTRQTKNLITHHSIWQDQKLQRGDEYTQEKVAPFVIEKIKEGIAVGFVSDAGTPGICDPGAVLVEKVLAEGLKVIGIPGPSSLSTFLSICGARISQWHFVGFFPRDEGPLKNACEEWSKSGGLWIGFESPHRIMKTLKRFEKLLPPETIVIVGKELTKRYENLWRAPISEVIQIFESDPELTQGEFVVALDLPARLREDWHDQAISLEPLLGRKKTSLWIAKHFSTKQSQVYDFLNQHFCSGS